MFGTHPYKTLTGGLLLAGACAAATAHPADWSLDLARVAQGEWWRLLTGQLVHLSRGHLTLDLSALGLTLLLCFRLALPPRVPAGVAGLAAVLVPALLLALHPVDVYGGLSGITAGLLALTALQLTLHDAPLTGLLLIAGLLLKIGLESRGLSASGVPPVWQAHCAGAAAGVLVYAFRSLLPVRITHPAEPGRLS